MIYIIPRQRLNSLVQIAAKYRTRIKMNTSITPIHLISIKNDSKNFYQRMPYIFSPNMIDNFQTNRNDSQDIISTVIVSIGRLLS